MDGDTMTPQEVELNNLRVRIAQCEYELVWIDAQLFTQNLNTQATRDFIKTDSIEAKRLTRLCELREAESKVKELKSELEGKMDGYHEVVYQLQQQVRRLEGEVQHQRRRANGGDDQLVWLANWCRVKFGVENNDVIGKEGWPNELVKVVAKVVNERVEELDDEIESLAASLRRSHE